MAQAGSCWPPASWRSCIDTIGDPAADLRSNIAAARAKIVYERLINLTDDSGVEALGFLMTREIAHQQPFEKALYSVQPNFPPGKLAGMPEFTNVYFNMSVGEGDARGPGNNEPRFQFREGAAVDGGTGLPEVNLTDEEQQLTEQATRRLASDPDSDPMTGAMLGIDGGQSVSHDDAERPDPKAAQKNALRKTSGAAKKTPARAQRG